MKKRIINLTIGLTGLVVSFLPQKAEAAYCKAVCPDGSWCEAIGPHVECECDDGNPECTAS